MFKFFNAPRITLTSRYLPIFLSIITLTSCSGSYTHQINFDPSEPLRVAIMPFAEVDQRGEIINKNYTYVIDQIPLLSSELEEHPSALIQGLVQRELISAGMEVVAPALVETQLSHSGYALEGGGFDLKRIMTTSPKELCAILSCDAVVFGKVTEWSRSYYGVQTVATVGFNISLRSAASGTEIFQSSAKDFESRGLTKGPTGFSSVVIEPILALNSELIVDLTARTVKEALAPLASARERRRAASPPPSIFAAAHDGGEESISPQRPLTVLMYASPGKQASFSIGRTIQGLPMIERDKGHYYGQFFPVGGEQIINQIVTVHLRDAEGRKAVQRLGPHAVNSK